jgi:hypothetical protein
VSENSEGKAKISTAPDPEPVLGLRRNLGQFSLLVLVNAFVGGMVGLERVILPLIAEREFGLVSKSVILSFIVGFGFVKAFTNLDRCPDVSIRRHRCLPDVGDAPPVENGRG